MTFREHNRTLLFLHMFGPARLDAALTQCSGQPDCVVDSVHTALFQHTLAHWGYTAASPLVPAAPPVVDADAVSASGWPR